MDRFLQKGKRQTSTPACDCRSTDSENDSATKKQNQAPDSSNVDNEVLTSGSSSCNSSMRSVASYFKRAILYDANSTRKKDIDRALTEMVAKDVKYSKILDPRYKLPSRTQLRDVLMRDLYKETSAKLASIFEGVAAIAVTCDLWTSSANACFITVTCHFIHVFSMKTASLATRKLTDVTNHSAQNIAYTLKDILVFWNILEKTVCVVTDNASSMLKACEVLQTQNLPCFAHTINLVVQDGLKQHDKDSTKALFTKCKAIVRFCRQSSIANEKFKIAQEHFAYTLLQETPTRWNSFYYMIERLLATHEAIATVLLSTTNAPMPFTADEINILKDIEKILTYFHQVTEKISGGTYVTVSLLIPLTYGLYCKLRAVPLETSVGESLKNVLLQTISKRLSVYEQRTVPWIATILDPRFKKDGFQHDSNSAQAATFLENELASLCNKDTPSSLEEEASTETHDSGSFFEFLDQQTSSKRANSRSDAIIMKRQYLERGIASQDIDPLVWFKVNQMDFPLLKNLILKYLCIPATSVESERAFSKAGQIVCERRTRLTEDNVNILLFVNQNLWMK